MVILCPILSSFSAVFLDAVCQIIFGVSLLDANIPAVAFVFENQTDLSGSPSLVNILAQLSLGRLSLSLLVVETGSPGDFAKVQVSGYLPAGSPPQVLLNDPADDGSLLLYNFHGFTAVATF